MNFYKNIFKHNDEFAFVIDDSNKLFKYMFASDELIPVLPEIDVKGITENPDGNYVVIRDGDYLRALYDSNFNLKIDYAYKCLDYVAENVYKYYIQMKPGGWFYGLITSEGKVLTEPNYTDILYGEGLFTIHQNVDGVMQSTFINSNGDVIIPAGEYYAKSFVDGICVIQNNAWDEKNGGIINRKGEILVPREYKFCGDFNEGLIIANKEGKWGYINTKGEVILPFEFQNTSAVSEGVLFAADKYAVGCFYNTRGEPMFNGTLFRARVSHFSEGLAPVSNLDVNLVGFIDKSGKFVIEPKYNDAYAFQNGYAIVENKQKQGVIDKYGNEILPCLFSEVNNCKDYFIVAKGSKYGAFDLGGKRLVTCKYADVKYLSPSFVAIEEVAKGPYYIVKIK